MSSVLLGNVLNEGCSVIANKQCRQRYVSSVLTPQLAAVHLRTWSKFSPLSVSVLSPQIPAFLMIWVFGEHVTAVFSEFSCFCCWQCLTVQKQEQPGLTPPNPPLSPALLISTPFSLLHKLLKANSYHHPGKPSTWMQNQLHYAMDENCFSMRRPVCKLIAWKLPN